MKDRSLAPSSPTPTVQEVGLEFSDLWDALKVGAPDVSRAAEISTKGAPATQLDSHPGFKSWLLTEFALNTPDKSIGKKIIAMREQQLADGIDIDNVWPDMGKRQVGWHRRNLSTEWRPLRATLEDQIQQVGVIRKNARLMALQSLYEQVNELAFSEKNASSSYYLIPEVRNILKAIGEEIGDLGYDTSGDDALKEIALELIHTLSIQGSGIQTQETTVDKFDYNKDVDGEFTEVEEEQADDSSERPTVD